MRSAFGLSTNELKTPTDQASHHLFSNDGGAGAHLPPRDFSLEDKYLKKLYGGGRLEVSIQGSAHEKHRDGVGGIALFGLQPGSASAIPASAAIATVQSLAGERVIQAHMRRHRHSHSHYRRNR
jgi:hypothetical protein